MFFNKPKTYLQPGESEFAYFREWRNTGLLSPNGEVTDYPVEVKLRPEPTNKHDKNAVQLLVDDVVLAYLPRDAAKAHVGSISKALKKNPELAFQGIARVWKDDGEMEYRLAVHLPVKW